MRKIAALTAALALVALFATGSAEAHEYAAPGKSKCAPSAAELVPC